MFTHHNIRPDEFMKMPIASQLFLIESVNYWIEQANEQHRKANQKK